LGWNKAIRKRGSETWVPHFCPMLPEVGFSKAHDRNNCPLLL
jgi:hypothetical protein